MEHSGGEEVGEANREWDTDGRGTRERMNERERGGGCMGDSKKNDQKRDTRVTSIHPRLEVAGCSSRNACSAEIPKIC